MKLGHRIFLAGASALVLQTALGSVAMAAPETDSSKSDASVSQIEVVVVTAEKRESRSIDVAGGLSAVSGNELNAMNAQSFGDYLGHLPGVVFNAGPDGDATAVIRGVGTTAGLAQGQGATGYYINDVPLTEPGYAVSIPDIDNFDVARVEVMRGPQGTLFGSSSLGGAINYVAKTADASGFHAAVEGGVNTTQHGNGQMGYETKGMINVPLVKDRLAVRAVGYYRSDPGYLDNVGTGKDASNKTRVGGGRLSVVWTPDADTTISSLTVYQNNNNPDFGDAMPDYGKLTKSTEMPEAFNTTFLMESLKAEHDFGFATLTAIGSYNRKHINLVSDYNAFYGGEDGIEDPVSYVELGQSKTWYAELRLTSPSSEVFDWVIGSNYQSTSKGFHDFIRSDDTAEVIGSDEDLSDYVDGNKFYWGQSHVVGSEAAVYGEGHYHFLKKFTATVGGRFYYDRIDSKVGYYGIFYTTPYAPDRANTDQSGFVPKFSLSYQLNPNAQVYALASKGYRFGSPNVVYPLEGFDTPSGTKTDTLWNYEAGYKGLVLDNHLQINADVFYIDWSNLQVRLYRSDSVTYGTNAGKARSYGFEFSGDWYVDDHLSLGANFTYLNSKLSEDLTSASTPLYKGQTLPGAAKYQLSDHITYNFGGAYQPTLTLSHSYESHAPGTLDQPQYKVYGYHKFDAQFSVNLYEDTTLTIYGKNLNNSHAATFTYGDFGSGLQEFIIRPRNFGVRVNWNM